MLTYKRLSQKPAAFKSITGISLDEFQSLLEAIRPRYQTSEQQRLARADRKRAPGGGAKSRYDLTERLLMTMIWLRLYLTCEAVGVLFDVDKSTVSRYTCPILLILQELGADTLGWPEEAQALVTADRDTSTPTDSSNHTSGGDPVDTTNLLSPPPGTRVCPDSVAIVDATEQRVERSHHYQTQKEHYSGKKKAHTRKTQVIVNEHGRIRDVSPSVPGSVHDATLLRQSKAADRIPPDVSAMGDSGYQGIQDDMSERSVALPYRASRGHPLTPEQKLHNHEISRIRIVVENTIAELKHFRSLVDVFRHAVARYDSVILAIVGIVNRRIDQRLATLGVT